jgi:hypothetical protein
VAEKKSIFESALRASPGNGDAAVMNLLGAKQFDAALLRLVELNDQNDKVNTQIKLFSGTEKLDGDALDTIEKYIDVLESRDQEVKDEGDINSRYLNFHNALNELLVRIQALIGTDSDGDKLDIPGKKIVDEIISFAREHAPTSRESFGDVIAGPFDSVEEANRVAEQFKQGTVQVDVGYQFKIDKVVAIVRPSYAALITLLPSLISDLPARDDLAHEIQRWASWAPPAADLFWKSRKGREPYLEDSLISSGSASQIQAVQLALEDIRKIHETETQFCLETYNRELTQFNNLVKMFSAYMESLTQNLKGFLS